MTKWKKLSHTIYQCKYHIVWCPKYRYRMLKGAVAEFVESNLRMLCEWRNLKVKQNSRVKARLFSIVEKQKN